MKSFLLIKSIMFSSENLAGRCGCLGLIVNIERVKPRFIRNIKVYLLTSKPSCVNNA